MKMTHFNKRVNITASAIGILLGLAGVLNHGIFEILQGNNPTGGYYIEAIGENHRFWLHGTEGAFTLIHNYLITGIAAILVGFAIVLWSIKYLHSKHGSTVFLALFILLTLVGGGIGHIILFIPTWIFATRINKPLDWWERKFPVKWRKRLSAMWIYMLMKTLIAWLIVMELGIFGYFPGLSNPEIILNVVFIFLFATVILACLTFVCAIARDIDNRNG